MMKNLIFAGTLGLMIASFSPLVQASENSNLIANNIHSNAHPNNASFQNGVHHFEIEVPKPGVSAISLDIPPGITVTRNIEVENKLGQQINAKVSMNDNKATLTFSEVIPANTILSVKVKGVKTNGYPNTWNYRIYGVMAGINQEIPLGTARIDTY